MPPSKKTNERKGIDVSSVLEMGASRIKKKIRDIERLIKKGALPADIRIENERALLALRQELKNKELNLKAKQLSKKYHMVRFFEKKKATRRLKQATKTVEELETKAAEGENVKKELKKAKKVKRHCEVDLAYVLNFPRTEKYVALFPAEEPDKDQLDEKAKKGIRETEERRTAYKKQFAEQLDNNTLEVALDTVFGGAKADHKKLKAQSTQEGIEVKDDEEDEFFE